MTDRPMVIGIGNKARSGKDTLADYLCGVYGAQKIRIAAPLYDECRKMVITIDGEIQYNGMTKKDPRLLVWWGEHKRLEDPEYWSKLAKSEIEKALAINPEAMIVIPDVRLNVCAKMVRELDGLLVRVNYVGTRVIDRDQTERTETELDTYPWDFTLNNIEGDRSRLFHSAENALLQTYGEERLESIRRRN